MNGSAIENWKLFPGSLRPNFAFACPACVEEKGVKHFRSEIDSGSLMTQKNVCCHIVLFIVKTLVLMSGTTVKILF